MLVKIINTTDVKIYIDCNMFYFLPSNVSFIERNR